MKRVLQSPVFNAVCLSMFSVFYAVVFIITSLSAGFRTKLLIANPDQPASAFLLAFSRFLFAGRQLYLAGALLLLTVVVIAMLVIRPHPYDEYHTALLTQCLVVSIILTLIAIAVFYAAVLIAPEAIIEKFTLFALIHWATVILADLVFVLICRWK